MKYSQAALIACIGGAALASAIPTGHTALSANGSTTPANRRTKAQRIGKGTAESLRTLASYAKGVNGQSYPLSTETETETGDNQVQRLQRRARGRHRASAKHRLSSLGSNLKGAGAAASEAAGGRVALANDLGTVVNLATTPSDSALTMRHHDAATAAAGDSGAPSHSSPSTLVDKSRGRTQQPSTNDQKKDKWRARKHPSDMPSTPPHSVNDTADNALAARAMYEDDSLSLRDVEHLLSSRDFDFDEEVFAREVAEEPVVARGRLKNAWNALWGKHTAHAPSPGAVLGVVDTSSTTPYASGDPNTVHQRDLIEGRGLHEDLFIRQSDDRLVEGREFDGHDHLLSSRDFDSDSDAELFARELAEELVARGRLTSAWNALRGKTHTEAPTPSPAVTVAPSVIDTTHGMVPFGSGDPNTSTVHKRDLIEDRRDLYEDLFIRQFDDQHLLSSRDPDSDVELLARELAEGLVERGRFKTAWNALRGKKHTDTTSPAAVPVPSVVDTSSTTRYASGDPKAVYKREHMINEGRDFDEDLSARLLAPEAARDMHEHISDALKRDAFTIFDVNTSGRHHKVVPKFTRDFIEDLDVREDLSAREFEELVARDMTRSGVGDDVFKKRASKVMYGVDTVHHLNVPGYRRDFIEDLDVREFDIDGLD